MDAILVFLLNVKSDVFAVSSSSTVVGSLAYVEVGRLVQLYTAPARQTLLPSKVQRFAAFALDMYDSTSAARQYSA